MKQKQTIGYTLKRLRKGKNLKLPYLISDILSESAYYKIEREEHIPSVDKMHHIVQKMNVSLDEFFYIANNYEFSRIEKLQRRIFGTAVSADTEVLLDILKECDEVLQIEKNNLVVYELQLVIRGQLAIHDNHFEEAKEIVQPIWNRLSKLDEWSLIDIKLINAILFLFSAETARNISKRALIYLEKYDDFLINPRLKIGFKLNLAAFLMLQVKEAPSLVTNLLEEAILEAKQGRIYDCYAVALFRKGLSEEVVGNKEGSEKMEKAIALLTSLEEFAIRDTLLKERQLCLGNNKQ